MNKLYFAALLLGVGIGAYGTADYFKNKYRTRADAEIESVRKAFIEERNRKKAEENPDTKKKTLNTLKEKSTLFPDVEPDDIPERSSVKDLITENKYPAAPGPHVISPDDFGAIYEYECVDLVYYADGYLVDDNQNVVKDLDDVIGEESLDHAGQYENGMLYVRNDELQRDYQIEFDDRMWRDVRQKWVR